jgi:K+-transporting ATPase KdpF subunit
MNITDVVGGLIALLLGLYLLATLLRPEDF